MSPSVLPTLPSHRSLAEGGAFLYLVFSGIFVLAALYALSVASWTTIAFDQWRIYDDYFALEFPQNVLASQNGHHPILPGLLFLADIHWFGAHNYLLNILGLALAVTSASCWSWIILRDPELVRPVRWMSTGVVWLLLFWLANNRTLGHGNESVHAFPVLGGLILAVWALLQSRTTRASGARSGVAFGVVAVVGCSVATFSFGLGLVTWPIVFGLAVILRSSLGFLLTLAGGTGAAALLLLFGLPAGKATPPEASRISLVEISVDAATWLGSPIFHSLEPLDIAGADLRVGVLAPALGAIGLAVGLATFCVVALRGRRSSDLEIWTLAVLGLGIGGAFLVSLARASYFDLLPNQRVAPRYLLWPCIFWIGALTALAINGSRLRRSRKIALSLWGALVVLLPVALLPSHSAKHLEHAKLRLQDASLGLALGIQNPDVTGILFRRPAVLHRVAERLRAAELGVFAGPTSEEVGVPLSTLYRIDPQSPFTGIKTEARPIPNGQELAVRFEGRIDGSAAGFSHVAIVDSRGVVAGWGTIRGTGHRLARRLGLLVDMSPRFAGYITGPTGPHDLAIYAASPGRKLAMPVGTIPASTLREASEAPRGRPSPKRHQPGAGV